jgi:hypothetical protein
VNSPQAVRAAAIAGLGFTTLPDFIARPSLKDGSLVSVLEEFVPTGGGIFAVYPHRRYLPAKVRALVDFLAAWFKQNGDDMNGPRPISAVIGGRLSHSPGTVLMSAISPPRRSMFRRFRPALAMGAAGTPPIRTSLPRPAST